MLSLNEKSDGAPDTGTLCCIALNDADKQYMSRGRAVSRYSAWFPGYNAFSLYNGFEKTPADDQNSVKETIYRRAEDIYLSRRHEFTKKQQKIIRDRAKDRRRGNTREKETAAKRIYRNRMYGIMYRKGDAVRVIIHLKKRKGEVVKMSAFDKIIGYAAIKKELKQITDTLKNGEIYAGLGVTAPRGLLLYGEPGVGKSLMASAVIDESGRRVFVCRKDRPNGDFIKEIKATFDRAAENAPSVVYLDDMDKFANGDERHPDAEEYVTVQSCIDEVKDKEVFVLATANNIGCLPASLRRAGRFDRKIEVTAPHGADAEKIIDHYLKDKKLISGIDTKTIARIMDGRSCAELETVINEAGLFAGYERAGAITMEHFTEACLRTVFNVPTGCDGEYDDHDCDGGARDGDFLSDANSLLSQIIYHEAGHAVVSEVLCPESVTLVSAHNGGGANGGFTAYYNDPDIAPLYREKSRIVAALAGAAAVEQRFGIFDAGCARDFDYAFNCAKRHVVHECVCGFRLHQTGYSGSEHLTEEQEHVVSAEIEKYYRKAKEILAINNGFFEKTVSALSVKRLLTAADIKRIKDECNIVPAAL